MDDRIVTGRDVSALLNPRPVVLVSAGTLDDPEIASIAWVTPLSHDPSLVGIAIRPTSVTCKRLRATGEFVINVLGQGFEKAVEICGASHGFGAAKASDAELKLQAGATVAAPHVAGALSWLECAVRDVIEAGDHLFVVGEVLVARTRCGCDSRGLTVSPDTLLCLQRGAYGTMAE